MSEDENTKKVYDADVVMIIGTMAAILAGVIIALLALEVVHLKEDYNGLKERYNDRRREPLSEDRMLLERHIIIEQLRQEERRERNDVTDFTDKHGRACTAIKWGEVMALDCDREVK